MNVAAFRIDGIRAFGTRFHVRPEQGKGRYRPRAQVRTVQWIP